MRHYKLAARIEASLGHPTQQPTVVVGLRGARINTHLAEESTVRFIGLLSIILVGCLGSSETAYEHYAYKACAQLQLRQEKMLQEYRISTWERYDWNQDTQELIFSHQGKPKVVAKIQFVGSLSNRSNTGRWAWANDTMVPGMKQDVLLVRALGEKRGWERLVTPQWDADEQDGWAMTAVAAHILNARGAYRTEDEGGMTYMIIKDIKWATEEATHESSVEQIGQASRSSLRSAESAEPSSSGRKGV